MTNYWYEWFVPKIIYFTLLGFGYLITGLFIVPPLAEALSKSMPNVGGWNIMLAMIFAMPHYGMASSLLGEFIQKTKENDKK